MLPLNSNDPYIDDNGKRSRLGDVIGSGGELPTASPTTKGGIKVGDGLEMSGETMSSKTIPNLLTKELICGSDNTYVYYVPMQRRRADGSYEGYEFVTVSTSMDKAIIRIDSILYNPSTSTKTTVETLATLEHNGVNTYSDDVISVSYNGGKWVVQFTTLLYDTSGEIQTSPVQWLYSAQVDTILLMH